MGVMAMVETGFAVHDAKKSVRPGPALQAGIETSRPEPYRAPTAAVEVPLPVSASGISART
jgi:hypothetical protein